MDSSGSVTKPLFESGQAELARLLGYLCPRPDPFAKGYQQAALIRFSTYVTEMFDFNDNINTQSVQNGILNMQYTGRSTCSATAFNYAKNTMFKASKGTFSV